MFQERILFLQAQEQYTQGPLAFNGTWAYRNGAQDDVSYSHMAMVDLLPVGNTFTCMAVWQAATRYNTRLPHTNEP